MSDQTRRGVTMWWRRPRELQRQLAATLVATALASVLLIGGLNYFAARQLLSEGTQEHLANVGDARARTIETAVDGLLSRTASLSGDLGTVGALEAFAAALDDLDDLGGATLTPEQSDALDQYYADVVEARIDEVGLDELRQRALLPNDPAARYLQYHYLVAPTTEGVEPGSVQDPGDGSEYSAVHRAEHGALTAALVDALGASDALLVTMSGDIVYSSAKRIDVGTNLFDGPYADTELAATIRDELPRQRSGSAVLADVDLYVPAGGRAVMFAAVAVKNETETIGALAVEIPVEDLSAITTSERRWDDVGLGSGESYVVGADRLLRSQSREWIEESESYLDGVKNEELAALMAVLGSPVKIQTVDNDAVDAAFNGTSFRGTTTNYLGDGSFTYATPIEVGGVDWVVVADFPIGEARAPLYTYARRLGLVLLIMLPAVALAGLWLARRLTRPIAPVLAAASAIAAGDRDPDIPDLGNDEFGDLGRRLRTMAEDLGHHEAALAAESRDRLDLLLAVLPARLVGAAGEIKSGDDFADTVTVVAITVETTEHDEQAVADLLGEFAAVAEAARASRAVERVRASADTYLYIAGLGEGDDGANTAVGFVEDCLEGFAMLDGGLDAALCVRSGVATGRIGAGLLDSGSLTFGAWGYPVRQALTLAALASADSVLADATTMVVVDTDGQLVEAPDVVEIDGEAVQVYTFAAAAAAGVAAGDQ